MWHILTCVRFSVSFVSNYFLLFVNVSFHRGANGANALILLIFPFLISPTISIQPCTAAAAVASLAHVSTHVAFAVVIFLLLMFTGDVARLSALFPD